MKRAAGPAGVIDVRVGLAALEGSQEERIKKAGGPSGPRLVVRASGGPTASG
jgi:hypothetical protein